MVIREALTRAAVEPAGLDDVIMGCVLQGGAGMNVARQAAIKAGVPAAVPAETVNRVCGSGLQAVVHATEATRVYAQVVVAGGTESMSQAPYLLPQARWGLRMGHGEIYDSMLGEGLRCAIERCHMGLTAEEVSRRFGISRADQDAFAAESQARAAAAIAAGAFREEIVPVPLPAKKGGPAVFEVDEHPRPGTSAATLGGLKPAFTPEGTVTAGNASGINDGAAALVVASPAAAAARGLPHRRSRPLVRRGRGRADRHGTGSDRRGPPGARARRAGRVRHHLFELNEAFAAQALAVSRELGLDGARVNVHGGAIALGHPIGASGARAPDHLDPCAARPRRRAGRRLSLHWRRDGDCGRD